MSNSKQPARTETSPATDIAPLPRDHTLLVCLLLAVVTLAIFSPALFNDFVNYDDLSYVTSNPHIQSGLTPDAVAWAFTTGHASNWHPLTWISHMLDWQFSGKNPAGHHATSILFHVANTLLLFLLLKKISGAVWRSAFVAALFALHPVHVESVAWISERKDVLSAFFFLLTLWAYAGYAQKAEIRGQMSEVRNPAFNLRPLTSGLYWLALFFLALGLMSKPMLVTTPFVLLLFDYWPLHRFELKTQNSKLKTVAWLIAEKIPFFALAVASSLATFIVQKKGGAVTSILALPLDSRIGNALVSYIRYLGKTFWPDNLAILYPYPPSRHWATSQVIGSVAILLAITACAIWLARRRKYFLVGWLWFLGTLVPVIGLVQVGIQAMADRYTYIPLIGIFFAAVWWIADATQSKRWQPFVLGTFAAIVLVVCARLTERQIAFWHDSETLFGNAVAVTEKNYLAYNNLGFHLANEGKRFGNEARLDEAIKNYRKAVEIDPTYEDAQNNLGHALAEQEKYAEAIPHYLAALRSNPKHVEVHNNLGNALASLGQIDQGIEHYRIALTNDPKHADAHNNLGIALAMKGKLDEAIGEFHAALKFKTNDASAHSNLGNAYAAQKKFDDAIREYEASLRLDPKDSQAQNNLGNVLTELGRAEEAIPHYRAALRLKAKNPEAHCNLGMALARLGKRNEAKMHFKEALRLKPDYEQAQRQLRALTNSASP